MDPNASWSCKVSLHPMPILDPFLPPKNRPWPAARVEPRALRLRFERGRDVSNATWVTPTLKRPYGLYDYSTSYMWFGKKGSEAHVTTHVTNHVIDHVTYVVTQKTKDHEDSQVTWGRKSRGSGGYERAEVTWEVRKSRRAKKSD